MYYHIFLPLLIHTFTIQLSHNKQHIIFNNSSKILIQEIKHPHYNINPHNLYLLCTFSHFHKFIFFINV